MPGAARRRVLLSRPPVSDRAAGRLVERRYPQKRHSHDAGFDTLRPFPIGGKCRKRCRVPSRLTLRASTGDLVEVLKQVVRGELDLLVAPLRGPVHAGDQSGAVDPAEVAVHERVAGLGLVVRRPRSGRGATRRTPPRSASRGRRSARPRRAATSPQSLSRTYWRASMSARAFDTAAGLTEYDAIRPSSQSRAPRCPGPVSAEWPRPVRRCDSEPALGPIPARRSVGVC